MKLKVLVGFLVLLIAINLGTIGSYLYFQISEKDKAFIPPEQTQPPFNHVERRSLRLKKNQRRELRKLLHELHYESQDLRLKLMRLEEETFSLLQADTIAAIVLDEKLKAVAMVRLEMSRKAVRKLIETKSFLSPDQRQHFFEAIMQVRPGGPGLRGNFPGRSPDSRFYKKDFKKRNN
jgi:uncharacterized membrane protein